MPVMRNKKTVPCSASCVVKAGEKRLVFRDSAPASQGPILSLCVVATQEESPDDGGSQSGLGTLEFGGGAPTRVEFDIREGTLLRVPATPFRLHVTNLNEPGDPDLHVQACYVHGVPTGRNTRSYLLDDENPNVRVPPFADSRGQAKRLRRGVPALLKIANIFARISGLGTAQPGRLLHLVQVRPRLLVSG